MKALLSHLYHGQQHLLENFHRIHQIRPKRTLTLFNKNLHAPVALASLYCYLNTCFPTEGFTIAWFIKPYSLYCLHEVAQSHGRLYSFCLVDNAIRTYQTKSLSIWPLTSAFSYEGADFMLGLYCGHIPTGAPSCHHSTHSNDLPQGPIDRYRR